LRNKIDWKLNFKEDNNFIGSLSYSNIVFMKRYIVLIGYKYYPKKIHLKYASSTFSRQIIKEGRYS